MKAVENVQCLRALLANHLQVGLPHVGEDKDDLRSQFVPDASEESPEGLDSSFPADPEKARHGGIDLVNQREVLVAFGVLDFVDSDGVDGSERSMRQSEGDIVFDGVVDLVP
jgi:hypothetical protein